MEVIGSAGVRTRFVSAPGPSKKSNANTSAKAAHTIVTCSTGIFTCIVMMLTGDAASRITLPDGSIMLAIHLGLVYFRMCPNFARLPWIPVLSLLHQTLGSLLHLLQYYPVVPLPHFVPVVIRWDTAEKYTRYTIKSIIHRTMHNWDPESC